VSAYRSVKLKVHCVKAAQLALSTSLLSLSRCTPGGGGFRNTVAMSSEVCSK
jgi:hypothetical protein